MNLVDFYTENYSTFLERHLSIQIEQETTTGKVDFMVASGHQVPKAPYFCLHEYKAEDNTTGDTSGQLLIAMVAAQYANLAIEKDIPIFGAFIIGRNFYFMVLKGKEYAFSDVFPATRKAVFEVFLILRKVKDYIDAVL